MKSENVTFVLFAAQNFEENGCDLCEAVQWMCIGVRVCTGHISRDNGAHVSCSPNLSEKIFHNSCRKRLLNIGS